MLGHWSLGSQALGAIALNSGSYIYAVNLAWQFGITVDRKLGIIYPPEVGVVLDFGAALKVALAHTVTFGLTFANSGIEKFGAVYPTTFGFELGADLISTQVELHRVGDVGFTLGATSVEKMTYAPVVSSLAWTFGESATVKAGAKPSASSGFTLEVTSSVLINGVITANSLFTLGSSAVIKWQPKYAGALSFILDAPGEYNPGYAIRPEIEPLTIEFTNATTWALAFWSKTDPVPSNMWVEAEGVENTWTPDAPITSSWTKDQAA